MKISYLKIKKLALPGGILLITLIIAVIGFSSIYKKITTLRKDIKSSQEEVDLLKERLTSLKQAETESISDSAVNVSLALPSKNPALFVASQIRAIAQENALSITELIIDNRLSQSRADEESVSSVNVTVGLMGDYTQIAKMIEGLKTSKPLLSINELTIEKSNNTYEAAITYKAHWSSLPATLPSINKPVLPLTSSEKQILQLLTTYKEASLVDVSALAPQEITDRPDPFSPLQ